MKRILFLCVLFSFLSLQSALQEDDYCDRLFLNCLSAQAIGCGCFCLQQSVQLSAQAPVSVIVQESGYQIINNVGIVVQQGIVAKAGISAASLATTIGYTCCVAGCFLCCLVQGVRLCD